MEELVQKAKCGDKEALLTLIIDKKGELYKLAYVYTGNKEDAMDAMQDMTVVLYEEINKLRKNELFYSWSKTILVNCCRDILKKKNRIIAVDEIKENSYHENYEVRETKLDILGYLKGLNRKQQEAIKLRYFMDMDYESIARISNVPVGTVKSRISTGLRKLKEILGGEY